ncbi:hypothetical protein AB204_01155 [Xenorhabdus khoisanae]|uniref:Uncharacterized protein n=1 Tax=Xenorhabdus khoisanae TaxID=880157 RepID=A0A0J5FYB8_9GAMM|nr:hypothetical protein [Xenorhabdus khoisanae]KMJ46927.1 hypothetical protein AB204_01155 [Xenorhabdus khoisanae]
MKTYVCVFEPTQAAQQDGAVSLAIALEANSIKMAKALAIVHLGEEYPEDMDKFNTDTPVICEDRVGSPRPSVGKFDEKFASEYEFDGTTWKAKVVELDTRNELANFSKVATIVRVAAILLFNTTELTNGQISDALKFVHQGTDQPKLRNIAYGLGGIIKTSLMNAAQTQKIVRAVQEHFSSAKEVDYEQVTQFGEKWLSGSYQKREFDHNYATLDLEIAMALLDGDFDCWEILSQEMSAAKKLMADHDEAWRRWSTAFRIRTDALSIPRETLFSVVREGKQHPELLTDADAMKAFLNRALGDTNITELQDEPNEPASIPEISAENVTADEVETQTAPEAKEEKSETKPRKTRKTRPAKKETVPETEEIAPEANKNGPKIEETVPETEKAAPKTEKDAPKTAANDEITPLLPVSGQNASNDNFQHRADLLEETIKAQGNQQQANLHIWKAVQRTDPRFTKPLEGMGYSGTSINSNYMLMRATEIFGPIGKGWGYDILEEKSIDGIPMTEPVLDERHKQIATRFLRDGDGSLIFTQNHSIKILFWYVNEQGERGEFTSYGATPYRYQSTYGPKADGEVLKKSLTDAIKKALSMLGFSADVFMGMHDNPEYLAENKIEFGIKAASDKAEDLTRLRKELDEKFARNTETMKTAITKNELRGIASTLTREIDVHLKNAKSLGDKEYERYLSGRLRRLTEIEKDCLTQLKEANP